MCFQFNPENPNLIAGGCINGQIIIWDIAEHEKLLRVEKKTTQNKNRKPSDVPIIKWFCVSPIEFSHKGPVTDIIWLESCMEHVAACELDQNEICKQLVSSSLDGTVLYWDTRTRATKDLKFPVNYVENMGKPFMRCTLSPADNSFEYSLTKFCFKQGEAKDEKELKGAVSNTSKFQCFQSFNCRFIKVSGIAK